MATGKPKGGKTQQADSRVDAETTTVTSAGETHEIFENILSKEMEQNKT